MERLYADCGELPSEGHCAAIIAGDSEAELLEAAAKHAPESKCPRHIGGGFFVFGEGESGCWK